MTDQPGKVLYLHGRQDQPETPPGDLVHEQCWPHLDAPWLDEKWLARPFARQLALVDRLLEGAPALAIGFSWGAYLLLAASIERHARKAPFPTMLLLSAIVGMGASKSRTGKTIGFIAPRANVIQGALGLDKKKGGGRHVLPASKVAFIHGAEDCQSPVEQVQALSSCGYEVRIVPGGHRLDTPDARESVRAAIAACRTGKQGATRRR